jgi:hypothetical protein
MTIVVRPIAQLRPAHTFTMPVVRELPAPAPSGWYDSTW